MNNWGKNRIKVVYLQLRTKNALSQNSPASLVLRFTCNASACQFLLTHFFTDFAKSQFVAIFHSIWFCALILAWVRNKGRGRGGDLGKSEMDKVLWVETDFSRILIMHIFLAIFHSICICRMVLALICDKWQRNGARLCKS